MAGCENNEVKSLLQTIWRRCLGADSSHRVSLVGIKAPSRPRVLLPQHKQRLFSFCSKRKSNEIKRFHISLVIKHQKRYQLKKMQLQ